MGEDQQDALAFARTGALRGAVFKGHLAPTGALAALIRAEVPSFAAIGGVVLNHAVGGLNPAAVRALARVGGAAARVVWLPTRDAANDLTRKGREGRAVIVTEGGRPVAALGAVVEAARDHRLVLASGHISPEETVAIFADCAGCGLDLVATHVTADVTPFTDEQVAAVLTSGAIAEICARNLLLRTPGPARADPDRVAGAAALIRRFGATHFLLSSDLGDPRYPEPVEGLTEAARALIRAGVSEADLEDMLVHTPRRLAGSAALELST